jgi:hypothetical protein
MRHLLAAIGVIVVLGIAGTGIAGAAPTGPASPTEATVVLYGDSLAWEAQRAFRDALTNAGVGDVRTQTMGGTAICDWLDQMQVDAAELHPTAVVVEFSGNALTPCMSDLAGNSLALSPLDYHRKYREDASTVLSIFEASGTRVYFAGAPRTRHAEEIHDTDAGWLNTVYARLAGSAPEARYVDAGATVLRRGHWTETLPCLADEPCTGGIDPSGRAVNVVRAPDGGHFCPGAPDANRGVTAECPVWSSGAHRYGTAMATAVLDELPS